MKIAPTVFSSLIQRAHKHAPFALLSLLVGAIGCTASASVSSSNSCGPDSSVSCSGSATGYSCNAGDPPPDANDSSLVCSEPTSAGDLDTYCCYSYTVASGSTCEQDDTVSSGCQPGSYGFSCTGSDTPDQDFGSNLNCSGATAGTDAQGASASLYCCTD